MISSGAIFVKYVAATTNSNLEVDEFLGKCAHLVVEAERVVSNQLRSEDEVALPLFFALQDDLSTGTLDEVVDIKRTTRLNLYRPLRSEYLRRTWFASMTVQQLQRSGIGAN